MHTRALILGSMIVAPILDGPSGDLMREPIDRDSQFQTHDDDASTTHKGGQVLKGAGETIAWLERLIESFEFDVTGLARRGDKPPYPLPTEPGTLAHLIETRAASHLRQALNSGSNRVDFSRGGQRNYPDIELSGEKLGNQIVALDIKVARRKAVPKKETTERRTQSRIALITGNSYFANPDVKHPNVARPYSEYSLHLDWVILFSIDETADYPEVTELEQIVAETWQIASKQRPSSTRNYIGAVDAIAALKAKKGEFASQEEFETYWRSFNWNKKPTAEELRSEAEVDGA
jgi:hypothetical protein